ncbi:MAG: hypothetical protein AAFX01_14535 [Cyanobacteria bacterium J06638_28]
MDVTAKNNQFPNGLFQGLGQLALWPSRAGCGAFLMARDRLARLPKAIDGNLVLELDTEI